MKKRINILILMLALAALSAADLFAQQSSSAVMQVRAEVVSATQIAQVHSGDSFTVESEGGTTFGEFTIQLANGTEFLTESEDTILMAGQDGMWKMNSEIEIERAESGEITLQFITRNNEMPRNGSYNGKQVATIQYL
jgi:hypothetical protein